MSVTNDVTYFIASVLQALNTALPLLLPKANEDVKMSIVVDSLPHISTSQKLDMLQESEEEVGLFPRVFLSHNISSKITYSPVLRSLFSSRA